MSGYQVFRPAFDRVLIDGAKLAGADVRTAARVMAVALDDEGARVEYGIDGHKVDICARMVIDCSGRAGVIGRRFRCAQPGHRTLS